MLVKSEAATCSVLCTATSSNSSTPSAESTSALVAFGSCGDDLATKPRSGCRRTTSTKCLATESMLGRALPDGRGHLCRDCFNCWRLMYAANCTLIMFGVRLMSEDNLREWEQRLIAYVSLKREGHLHCTAADVYARRDTIALR
jgi:hypothetical protein